MTHLSPAATDLLRRQLEELGLTAYQARALAALLVAGTANSVRLAELARVQRTSIYRTMDTLTDQGLTETVPTHGPTVWACQAWRPVLDTLDAAAQQRLDQHQARTRHLRHTLTQLLPDNESISANRRSARIDDPQAPDRGDAHRDPPVPEPLVAGQDRRQA